MPDTMLFAWMGDDVEAILFARVRSHDRVRRDRRRSRSETARALEGNLRRSSAAVATSREGHRLDRHGGLKLTPEPNSDCEGGSSP